MTAASLLEREPRATPAEIRFPRKGLALADARFVLVVPPFASSDRPSLGAHIIASSAARCGFPSEIVYGNLSFAALVGVRDYERLCHAPTGQLVGERIFSKAVYGDDQRAALDERLAETLREAMQDAPMGIGRLQALAVEWADYYAERLAELPASIIGFTSTFEQSLASLALIKRLKRHAPGKRLILGGANVDGEMAGAMAELCAEIDHVFRGESELSFTSFLKQIENGENPDRVIAGVANQKLDDLSAPDYRSYTVQLEQTVGAGHAANGLQPEELWIPYESSRGCWWGVKHHCTFCGLNALGMGYREKQATKVVGEVCALVERHPGARILMVDNIMPFSYFATVVPEFAKASLGVSIFYEQKANLSLARMRLLAQAGIDHIQPGIESLDTSILKLMRKGSSLRTNLECLRFGRATQIDLVWNLIVDFPGEEEEAYEAMADLIPHIVHLQPPGGISPLSIERFSPYFDESAAFGIAGIRPIPAYDAAHPGVADTRGIAYHFEGDYSSACRRRPDLRKALSLAVDEWLKLWSEPDTIPLLEIFALGDDRFVLCDTRPGVSIDAELINAEQARMCLTGLGDAATAEWALARHLVWRDDGLNLPLAVAGESSLMRFIPG